MPCGVDVLKLEPGNRSVIELSRFRIPCRKQYVRGLLANSLSAPFWRVVLVARLREQTCVTTVRGMFSGAAVKGLLNDQQYRLST